MLSCCPRATRMSNGILLSPRYYVWTDSKLLRARSGKLSSVERGRRVFLALQLLYSSCLLDSCVQWSSLLGRIHSPAKCREGFIKASNQIRAGSHAVTFVRTKLVLSWRGSNFEIWTVHNRPLSRHYLTWYHGMTPNRCSVGCGWA